MVFTKTKMKRKRRVECVSPLLDDSPKRTKVHAQRKFAQGSNVNSPVITPVKEIERQQDLDLLPEPVELLPMKRPNTEDFLTFLCFRGTPILPPTLNFFNTASIVDTNGQVHEIKAESPKNGPIDTSVIAKTGSGSSEKPFIAFGVRKRADPIVISRQMDRKRRHALALQALRRKYQEQKMAKIRAVTISKLSEKTTSKGPLKSQTQNSAANYLSAGVRNEATSRKTNASAAGGSGSTAPINKSKNLSERATSKRVHKIIVNAKTKIKVKPTASNVKIITKPKMCLRSFRGRFVQKELPFNRTTTVRRKSLPVPSAVKKVVIANKNLRGAGAKTASTSQIVTKNVVKKKKKEDEEVVADCYSSEDDEPLARTSKIVMPKIAKKSAGIVPKKTVEMNCRMTRSKQFIANKKTSRRQQMKKLILTTPKTMVKPRTLRSHTLVKKSESPLKTKKQLAVVVNKAVKSSKAVQNIPNLGKRKIDSEPVKSAIKENLRKNFAEEKRNVKAVKSDETTKVDVESSVRTDPVKNEPPKKDLKAADIADKRDLKVELCRSLDKDSFPKSPDLPTKDESKNPAQSTSSAGKLPSRKGDKSGRNLRIIEALKRREQERIKLVNTKKSPTVSTDAEYTVGKIPSNKKQNVGKKLTDKKDDSTVKNDTSVSVKTANQPRTVADSNTAKKETSQKSESSVKNRPKSSISNTAESSKQQASTSQRPTRKTKEAAAIYMEILSHKLVNESKIDDDNVSIDSFPELPNVKKTEQRENELKAKANKHSELEISEICEAKKDSVKQKGVKSVSIQDSELSHKICGRKDAKLKTTDSVVMEAKNLRSSDKKFADKRKSPAVCDSSPDEMVTQSTKDNDLADSVVIFAEDQPKDTEKSQKAVVVDKNVRSLEGEAESVVGKDLRSLVKDAKLVRKDTKLLEKDAKSVGKSSQPTDSNPKIVETNDDTFNENYCKVLRKDAKPIDKNPRKGAKPLEQDAAVVEKNSRAIRKLSSPVDLKPKVVKKDDVLNKNYSDLREKDKKPVEKFLRKEADRLEEDASIVVKDAKSIGKVCSTVGSNTKIVQKDDALHKKYPNLLEDDEKSVGKDFRKDAKQPEKDASVVEKDIKSIGKSSQPVDSNLIIIVEKDDVVNKKYRKLLTEDEGLIQKEVRKDAKQLDKGAVIIEKDTRSIEQCSLAIDSNPKVTKRGQNDCKLLRRFEKSMEKDARKDAKQLGKSALVIEKDANSIEKRSLQIDSNPKVFRKDDTVNKNYRRVLEQDQKPVEKEAKKEAKQREQDAPIIQKDTNSVEKISLPVDSNLRVIKEDDTLNRGDLKLLRKCEKPVQKDFRKDPRQLEKDASIIGKDAKSTGRSSSLSVDSNPKLIKKDDTLNKGDLKLLKKCEKPVEIGFRKDPKQLEKDASIIEKDAKSTGRSSTLSVDSNPKLIKKDDTLNKGDLKLPKKCEKPAEKDFCKDPKQLEKDASIIEKDAKSTGRSSSLSVDSNPKLIKKDDTLNKSDLKLFKKCEKPVEIDFRKDPRQLEKDASIIEKDAKSTGRSSSLSVDSNHKLIEKDDTLNKGDLKLLKKCEKPVEIDFRKDPKQLEKDASIIGKDAKSTGRSSSLSVDSNPKLIKKDDTLNKIDLKLIKKCEKPMGRDIGKDTKQPEKDALIIEKDAKSTGKFSLLVDSNPKFTKVKDDALSKNDTKLIKTDEKLVENDVKSSEKETVVTTVPNIKIPKITLVQDARKIPTDKAKTDLVKTDVKLTEKITRSSEKIVSRSNKDDLMVPQTSDRRTRSASQSDKDLSVQNVKSPAISSTLTLTDDEVNKKATVAKQTTKLDKKLDDKIITSESVSALVVDRSIRDCSKDNPNKRKSDRVSDLSEPESKILKSEQKPRLDKTGDKSGKNLKELKCEPAVSERKICRIDYKKDTNSTGPLKLEATISSEEITKIVQPKNLDKKLPQLKSAVGNNEQSCGKIDTVLPKNVAATLQHAKSDEAVLVEKRSIIDVITKATVEDVTQKEANLTKTAVKEQDETETSVNLAETKFTLQQTSKLVETLESDDSDNAFLVDIKLAKNKKTGAHKEVDEKFPGKNTEPRATEDLKELPPPTVKNSLNNDRISSSDSDRSTTSDVVKPKPPSTSRIANKPKKFTKTRSLKKSDDQSFSDSDEEPLSKLTQNKPAPKTVENKRMVAEETKAEPSAEPAEEPSPMTTQKSEVIMAPEKPVLENEAKPKRECAKRPQYYLPMFSSSSSEDDGEFLTADTKKIDFKSKEAPVVTQGGNSQQKSAFPTSDVVQQKRELKSALPTSDIVQQKRDLATAGRKFATAKTSTTKSLERLKKFSGALSQPTSDLLLSSKDLGRRFGKGKVNMSNEQIEQWLKDSAMAGGSGANSKSSDVEIFEEYNSKIPTETSLSKTDLFEKIDTGHLKASLLNDSNPAGPVKIVQAEELVKEKSSAGAQVKPKSLQQPKLKLSGANLEKSKTKMSSANALTINTIYSNIKDQMASPTSIGDSRKLIFRKDKGCAQVPNVNAFSAQNESSVYAFGDDNDDEVMKTPFRRLSRRPSSTATSRSEDESCKIDETSTKPTGHFRKPLVKQQQGCSRTSGTEDANHTDENLTESTTNQQHTPATENEDSNDQSNLFYTPTSAQQRIKSNLSKMASRLSSMLAPSSTVNLKSGSSSRAATSSGDALNKNSGFPACAATTAAKSGGRSAELLAEEYGGTKYKIPSSPSASSSSSAKLYNSAAKRQKSTATGNSCGSSKMKPIEILPVVLPDFPAGSSIAHVVEAPTFHPTDKEFQDPLEYIEKIRLRAEQFGICRIVPPSTFKPECKVTDDMRFTAYNQYVNKMLYRWGPNFKELMAIRKYLSTQNISLNQPPWIGGMEIDLPRLYQTVQMLGGLKEVIEKKKWPKVSDVMKIPKSAQDRVTKLDDIYCKYLLPYDTLSPAEREKLFDEVETEWAKRESKSLLKVQQQNDSERKNTENPQDNNDSDTETSENDESEECIVKGRNIALNAFYRIARNTMSMWFRNSEPPAQEVEQEFWKHVILRQNHICVHSGSIDSGSWGYGFAVSKNSPFARHAWNLKVLTNNSGSVLRALGPMMGLTVPTLHVGMLFSSCCWYRDPHGLPWIEYLHTGGNKIWYAVPKSTGGAFNEVLRKLVPNYCRNKPLWLPSDTVMVPPDLLTENGVSLSRIVQEPGQFVVVFPKVFTSSISTGYVVSESVYFAPSYWLSTARAVFEDLRNSCEPSMFSLDRLLLSIVNDQRSSVDVLRQIIPAVQDICDAETRKRNTIANELGVTLSEKLPPPEAPKTKKKKKIQGMDGDYECDICRMSLFISMVLESQDDVVYCLDHAIEQLQTNKIQSENCKLLYTFDEEELGGLVPKINAAIENKLQKKIPNKYAGMPTLLNK